MRSSRKYPYSPTEGIGISWAVWVGLYETKNLKKCMKLNWNFLRGGEVLEKNPFHGEVCIFSGTTQSCEQCQYDSCSLFIRNDSTME